MEQSINDQFRKKLWKDFNEQQTCGISLDRSVREFVNQLYEMQMSKDLYKQIMYDTYIAIAYLDTYKINNYAVMNNNVTFDQMEMIGMLDEIDDIDDLKATVSADPNLLEKMIFNIYRFYELPITGKMLVMKNLSSFDHSFLQEMVPTHQYDLQFYGRNIDASFLVSYYESIQKLVTQVETYYQYDMDHAIDNIVGFLKGLSTLDYSNFSNIIKQMMALDYEWSIYFLSKQKFDNEIAEYEARSRMEFIEDENFSIEEIIFLYFEDTDYLKQLVTSYIDITCQYEHTSLKDEVIDFSNKKISKKIKQKMKDKIH